MNPVFVQAERRVAEVGPFRTVTLESGIGSGHHGRAIPPHHVLAVTCFRLIARTAIVIDHLGTAAIVRQEHDQRVVLLTGGLQRIQHPSDAPVETLDLRRVHFHAALLPLFVRHRLPSGNCFVARRDSPLFVNRSGLNHSLVTRFAQLVPALFVVALVLLDILLAGVQRPVRRSVGEVHEERIRRVFLLLYVTHGLVGKHVGVVVIALRLNVLVVADQQVWIPIAVRSDDRRVHVVEATLPWPIVALILIRWSDVPLANHGRCILHRLQSFGDCHRVRAQIATIAGYAVIVHHMSH